MAALGWTETLDPAPSLLTVDEPSAVVSLLGEGAAAIVVDRVSALGLAHDDPSLRILDPPVATEPYVVAARVEDETLLAAIDEHLSAMAADGTLGELVQRWILP
jgi:ABC-type amino acid transport substrate-binding protein